MTAEKYSLTSSIAAFVPAEPETRTLESWIKAAAQGNEAAFDRLYRLYAEKIYNYCLYRLRNQTEAEDLTAQVFFQAWQALGRFRTGEAPFLSWLYRIAHNLVVNYYKSRRHHYEVADAGLDEYVVENLSDQAGPATNPLERLVAQGQQAALLKALEQLTAEQRQIIYLRFIENYSHTQIAQLVGKKEGAVRALQFRAVERLGKLLGKEHYFDD